MKKHKFRWGEEEYTICITQDDWWMDDPVDMSEKMIKGANEFALEHGMAPSASTCINCGGTYVDTKKDYHIASKILHDLDQRRCWNCGHTIFPPKSVEKIDAAMAASTESQ